MRKKLYYIFSALIILIIVAFIVIRTSSRSLHVSKKIAEKDSALIESASQIQTNETSYSHNWLESFNSADNNSPVIDTFLPTDSEEIQLTFEKNEFFMFCESFPLGIVEFNITDENGNITIVPCYDNGSDNNVLVSTDNEGYNTLVELMEHGQNFSLTIKGKDTGSRSYSKTYLVEGFSAPGLRTALKKHIGK